MATRFRVEFRGLRDFTRRLRASPERIRRATAAALYQEAEELMTAAKRLTPVDEGNLRASGHVQLPVMTETRITVTLGFGGPAGSGNGQLKDVGYAVIVHEDLTAYHDDGQAKYLEQPLNARRGEYDRRLADKIRQNLAL